MALLGTAPRARAPLAVGHNGSVGPAALIIRPSRLRAGALSLAGLRDQAPGMAVLLLSLAPGCSVRPNNSFKPTPLRGAA